MKSPLLGNTAALIATILTSGLSLDQIDLAARVAGSTLRRSPDPCSPKPYDGSTRQQRRAMERMARKSVRHSR